jgi:hypothetical protein
LQTPARTAIASTTKTAMSVFFIITLANDMRERRRPAAPDVGIVSELNGWSPSAPRKGWADIRKSSSFWPPRKPPEKTDGCEQYHIPL